MSSIAITKENFAFQCPKSLHYPHKLGYAMVTNNTKFPCHTKFTLDSGDSPCGGPTFQDLWAWDTCISLFVSEISVAGKWAQRISLCLWILLLRSDACHVHFTLHWPKKVKRPCSITPGGKESFSCMSREGEREWETLVSPHNVPGSYVVACKNLLQHFFRENYFFLQLMNISLSINGTLLL